MKFKLFFLFGLFLSNFLSAQILDSLEKRKGFFENEIKRMQDSITTLNRKIFEYNKSLQLGINDTSLIKAVLSAECPIKKLPELLSTNIRFAKTGDTVLLYPKIITERGFRLFMQLSDGGYVDYYCIKKNYEIATLFNNYDTKAKLAAKQRLVSKYGAKNAAMILEGKIWLGMTSAMAKESWGEPEKVNRTVGTYGQHEQWIYGQTYLYFENGILKTWQD
jgi:hypothetical protein